MKDSRRILCALAFSSASTIAIASVGCSSSSNTLTAVDAGHDSAADATSDVVATDSATTDSATADTSLPVDSSGPVESGPEGGTPDAGPPRLLVTYGVSSSELYAVDLAGQKIDGMLAFPGAFGAPVTQPSAPFLLEQAVDLVARLDPTTPWVIDSSWNVALADDTDGGGTYSDPYQVIVAGPTTAYVLRYTRNDIAVINPTANVDGGAPAPSISLASLAQPGGDGFVEMTAGVYVAATSTLYVVLANINRNLVVNEGENLLCSNTVSSVIGVDTMTNAIKSLGGTAPGGGIALEGFDPITGGIIYDAANGRLLVDESGCNAPDGDGGAGAIQQRSVEAVTLATGQTQILLDETSAGVPSAFVYIDATHAILGYDYTGSETMTWNPTQTTVGTALPDAPDLFVYDGVANLVGVFTPPAGGNTAVVSAPVAGGAATTILSNPFPMSATCGSACAGGLALWPQP